MARKDSTFDTVMKGVNGTKGLTKEQQAELDKRRAMGEKQAANDRQRRKTQAQAKSKKAQREADARWKNRGGGDVIDSGMFR